jgi:hypothetical protein
MSEKRKLPPPVRTIFTPGDRLVARLRDRVAYVGARPRYLGGVGTVFKVKADGCHVQFDDDPVLASGGVKTSLISLKELRPVTPPD